MVADRATIPSVHMQGDWNMLDENGTVLNGNTQMDVSFSTQDNLYLFTCFNAIDASGCGLERASMRKRGQSMLVTPMPTNMWKLDKRVRMFLVLLKLGQTELAKQSSEKSEITLLKS